MLLEHDSIIVSLPDCKSTCTPLVIKACCVQLVSNWARYSQQVVLEALTLVGAATTTHARHLVMHRESAYRDLHCLKSIAPEILKSVGSQL